MSYKIKDLPTEEKPREKAQKIGIENLTTSELLAILLRTGTKEKNAKELAIDILNQMENLKGIKNSKINQLAKIKGVGQVKAITLLSALELGYRLNFPPYKNKIKIDKSEDVYNEFKNLFYNTTQEKFLTIFLNIRLEVIDYKIMFIGSSNQSIVEPKSVFKEAILYDASKIIIVHNHPSGNPIPSKEDISLTKNFQKIGSLLEIPLIDHLIFGKDTYYSFYEFLRKEKSNVQK